MFERLDISLVLHREYIWPRKNLYPHTSRVAVVRYEETQDWLQARRSGVMWYLGFDCNEDEGKHGYSLC
jgi:hypothetical protein